MLSVILFSAAYIDLACFRQLPCAIIYIYVEKNPSIKVHRVADPLFFSSPNLSLTLVQSVVHWYCVLVRSRGAVVSFPV